MHHPVDRLNILYMSELASISFYTLDYGPAIAYCFSSQSVHNSDNRLEHCISVLVRLCARRIRRQQTRRSEHFQEIIHASRRVPEQTMLSPASQYLPAVLLSFPNYPSPDVPCGPSLQRVAPSERCLSEARQRRHRPE